MKLDYFLTSSFTFLLRRDFLQAPVFFLRTFFWIALSMAFMDFLRNSWAFLVSPEERAFWVAFMALRKAPLILVFFSVFLLVTRMYFLADFLIGIDRFAQTQNAKIKMQNCG